MSLGASMSLAGLSDLSWSESQYWESADPVQGHAMAQAAGVHWIPGRGWTAIELGLMDPATIEQQTRANNFWPIADQFVRDGRAAAVGMKWDAARGTWVSLTTGAPVTPTLTDSGWVVRNTAPAQVPTQLAASPPTPSYAVGGSFLQNRVNVAGNSIPLWMIAAGAVLLFLAVKR